MCRQRWDDLVLVDRSFFFSSLENHKLVFFVVDISISIINLLIFNFYSWPFCKSFICFQLSPLIWIFHVLLFFNFVFIIWISDFFPLSFYKSFWFHHSIQVYDVLFCFNLILILFGFFILLLKLFFFLI